MDREKIFTDETKTVRISVIVNLPDEELFMEDCQGSPNEIVDAVMMLYPTATSIVLTIAL